MDLPAWFHRFLEPDADRFGLLMDALAGVGVEPRPVELAGGRFIVVAPRREGFDQRYRVKAVSAHYDRVPGTPGALDNSAACLQIWKFLSAGPDSFNTVYVFTDREELSGGDPAGQGSYFLGKAMAGLGFGVPWAFPLDVTGCGDTLVLSRASEGLGGDGRVPAGLLSEVESMAGGVSRLMAGRARLCRARIPFGEDLGYLLAGIPALALSVLPRDEAALLEPEPGFGNMPAWASLARPGGRRPRTWRTLHGPGDLPSLYTEEAFGLAERLLGRLAAWKEARPLA